MSTYIFDIETGPRSRAELAACVPHFEAPGNWKDPEKIRAYVTEKEAEWFQSGALDYLANDLRLTRRCAVALGLLTQPSR
jgi:hypothetical protein